MFRKSDEESCYSVNKLWITILFVYKSTALPESVFFRRIMNLGGQAGMTSTESYKQSYEKQCKNFNNKKLGQLSHGNV